MGRKTKYSAASVNRFEMRETQIQQETVEHLQLIHRARNLLHTKRDIYSAAINYYYENLLKIPK